MTAFLFALLATVVAGDGPSAELFAFDNSVGRGQWTPAQQAATLKELGYAGISYNYTKPKDLQAWLTACKGHGIKLQGLYVHTFPDKQPCYDPPFKEAIAMLKGSDTVIWMTLREAKDKTRNYDAEAGYHGPSGLLGFGVKGDLRGYRAFLVQGPQAAVRAV